RIALERVAPGEPGASAPAPTQLRLPIALGIDTLAVDRLDLPGLAAPLEQLRARFESHTLHRVDALSLRWQGVLLEGEATLGADAPLPLQARVAARSDADATRLPAWARALALDAQARGTLTQIDLQARLAMQNQRLDLQARISPFDALPLPQLDARFERLDLARLLAPLLGPGSAAPGTELSGLARVQLGSGTPLLLHLAAQNAAPGGWDTGRLPLRDADVLLRGQGGRWSVERATLQLAADARTPAGRLSASGWLDGLDRGGLAALSGEATLMLDALRPDLLDRRGPPLRLSGPLTLRHAPATTAGAAFGALDVEARLGGALQGAARARVPAPLRDTVLLALRGRATPEGATIEQLETQAGGARLEAHGEVRRAAEGWRSRGRATLARFDPAPWLPGDPAAAWRRGPNRLQGHLDWQAELPATGDRAARLRGLRGTLAAELDGDSRLAGQPLALTLQARADAAHLSLEGELRAAGNRLGTSALLARAGDGDDRAMLRLDAPALEQLAPMAELLGLGTVAGRATGETSAEGALRAWLDGSAAPQRPLTTRGRLSATGLRWAGLQLGTAEADWEATLPGAAANAALERAAVRARLDARALQLARWRVPRVALQADGSLAEHQASLTALLQPPATAASPLAGDGQRDDGSAATAAALTLDATLAGRWSAGTADAPGRWQLTLPGLRLQPAPGALNGTLLGLARRRPGDAGEGTLRPLLSAENLAFELDRSGGAWRFVARPGSADLLGATLRWRTLHWAGGSATAPPRFELDAEVEPLRVADWLQRLQPDFGWRGDLRVGASARIRSEPTFSAAIEIARTGGDLAVDEFGVVQPLGLSEARLALGADAGHWRMTQQIVGRQLGRIDGEQTLRTGPERLWPEPDAPIAGRLGVQVDKLGTWGAWVPAGWRLAGQLDATLQVAGRFGAPELIGEARGRDIGLRNALEGVALSEGQLDARFEGETATLGTLRFKAGEGQLAVSGDARLGAEPRLELRLQATRATVLGRVDRRVVASGEATLRADRERIALLGQVRADEGLIDFSRGDAPRLGDDVSVRHRGERAPEPGAPEAERRTPRALEADLRVDLGPRFVLRGRGLDTRLGGELRFTTPGGKLGARGEIRTERGTYEAYGQKLSIERGVITFVGPLDNPRLDIEAVRPHADVRVGVRVGGSAQAPRVRLFSEPELPATEQLALLVTGRSYGSLGGADTLLLQRAAFALLAGDGSSETDFNVARALQLDELSVRQSDGVVRDTVVTLGKQLSERLYLGYERGLEAAAGNWQLIYRIAQRFTLRAQSGDDSALDLIWLFRW
ncbi:MAG TPA: translocation/assembly module TamB domain-containing protein, partial [Methylibium sp.]|nr:translocation/assembly module TamB domain-containing protein [Methylibium sp.]